MRPQRQKSGHISVSPPLGKTEGRFSHGQGYKSRLREIGGARAVRGLDNDRRELEAFVKDEVARAGGGGPDPGGPGPGGTTVRGAEGLDEWL